MQVSCGPYDPCSVLYWLSTVFKYSSLKPSSFYERLQISTLRDPDGNLKVSLIQVSGSGKECQVSSMVMCSYGWTPARQLPTLFDSQYVSPGQDITSIREQRRPAARKTCLCLLGKERGGSTPSKCLQRNDGVPFMIWGHTVRFGDYLNLPMVVSSGCRLSGGDQVWGPLSALVYNNYLLGSCQSVFWLPFFCESQNTCIPCI